MLYTRTEPAGVPPIDLIKIKQHLRIRVNKQDALLETYLNAAVTAGEKYTSRDFRANTWTATASEFIELEEIHKAPIDTITSLKYLVSDVLTTIATSVYYFHKCPHWSAVLLQEDQVWPTDIDDRLGGIELIFTTVPTGTYLDEARLGLLKHVAYLYENPGDFQSATDDLKASGAAIHYSQFRIPRI
jgi:hypothetical protein